MKVSKDELLHIAKLADLKIEDDEIDNYLKNLDDILEFTKVLDNAPIDGLDTSSNSNNNFNVMRNDEVKVFKDRDALLKNSPVPLVDDMFKVPKVIQ